ncbi:hypothetical protein BpJC7_15580 [Weizmannia acidilactici]|uniref:Uncharacterized protein n=1 Tax=Weizmannia acidilactici TaxID=2607726 RepID=A0A5J4JHU3_9BACI|nr:hypothetical protein BpJC4_09940 [Weizmannia acidilactici]GER70255.1 hypothetical protein BpJC7_15580 [Weizmannia acidilactici]GER74892.1 hypothetical protein BpPP18_29590 [Weizmannia acidilactici]
MLLLRQNNVLIKHMGFGMPCAFLVPKDKNCNWTGRKVSEEAGKGVKRASGQKEMSIRDSREKTGNRKEFMS